MNKKIICPLAALLSVGVMAGCGEKTEMPENMVSFKDRNGKDLVPVTETEVSGVEPEDAGKYELPSEDELGEYEEIFMEGDIIDEETVAGWVVTVSTKDITVNTYNSLTTYLYEDEAANTGVRVKPGDAVVLSHYDDEDGNHIATRIGRVRVEDEPLTRDEIMEQYFNVTGGTDGGATDSGEAGNDGE